MVQVSSCCGFVSVENGSYIAAVIQIIIGAIEMVYKSYLAATLSKEISQIDANQYIYKVLVATAVGSALQVIVGFLLYVGVRKKNTKCVLIWLWFTVVSLWFMAMALLCMIIILVQTIRTDGDVGILMTIFITAVVITGLEIYLVVVVNSFHEIIKRDNTLPTTTRLI